MLKAFIEKHPAERELVDRAKIYIAICEEKPGRARKPSPSRRPTIIINTASTRPTPASSKRPRNSSKKPQKMNPEDGKVHYALADLHCLMGQTDVCLEHLKKAIQIDKFFRILAQNETDFEPLWEDKKFKLITRIV